jgi:hypothetical protein
MAVVMLMRIWRLTARMEGILSPARYVPDCTRCEIFSATSSYRDSLLTNSMITHSFLGMVIIHDGITISDLVADAVDTVLLLYDRYRLF